MATVTKPIALDESLNTTETPSRNVADVLAEELQNIAQAIGGSGGDSVSWTQIQSTGTKIAEIEINGTSTNVYAPNGGGGGGGHTIEGADGTALSQEPTLQFADADASDDAVNEKTVVNVVRKRTQAQYDAMSAADKAKGIIEINDANAKPLFDTQVRRSNGDGTVADALKGVVCIGEEITETISVTSSYQNLFYGTGQAFTDGVLIGVLYRSGNETAPFSLLINLSANNTSRVLIESETSMTITISYRPVYVKISL